MGSRDLYLCGFLKFISQSYTQVIHHRQKNSPDIMSGLINFKLRNKAANSKRMNFLKPKRKRSSDRGRSVSGLKKIYSFAVYQNARFVIQGK